MARSLWLRPNLRLANLSLNFEFALQAIDDNLQVQLPHALDDRLVRLLISAVAERWILSGQLVQGLTQLIRILLRSWLATDLAASATHATRKNIAIGIIIPGTEMGLYNIQYVEHP